MNAPRPRKTNTGCSHQTSIRLVSPNDRWARADWDSIVRFDANSRATSTATEPVWSNTLLEYWSNGEERQVGFFLVLHHSITPRLRTRLFFPADLDRDRQKMIDHVTAAVEIAF